jgi:uncharacterized protein (DUF885 family)
MKRSVLLITFSLALLLALLMPATAVINRAAGWPTTTTAAATVANYNDPLFKSIHDAYVVEFLRRNPTTSTYLGGIGLDARLKEADGRLRDHSATAIAQEDKWLTSVEKSLEAIDPQSLSAQYRIDREVILSHTRFQLHLHQVRRYQQRALDTYTDEPFRAVDFQIQGLTATGKNTYGTNEEWQLVIKRLNNVPQYLRTTQEQLIAGIQANNTPDWRMLRRNGLDTTAANAKYFETTVPQLASERIAAGPQRDELLLQVRAGAQQAATAFRELNKFIAQTFFRDPQDKTELAVKPQFRGDRFILGEPEYSWATQHNLLLEKSPAQLFEEAWPVVQNTQQEMINLAQEIGQRRGLKLPAGAAAVRAVFDELSKEYPQSDAEMVNLYRKAAFRLVDYARKTGIFDVPADYQLEVIETPPPLQASIDGAAYYPAPPFKNTGVGRFFVTPTGNSIAGLQSNNLSSLADLSAHEGFPGHDWHYKLMTQFRDVISPVRWLTPGAIEDSSSMWQDSMAAEGWGLYAEALMAEPQPGFPQGFYTPEERLYQLQGKLYRDLRVRIDTGIHTSRLSYDDAVTLYSTVVDFLPGDCQDPQALKNDAKRESCGSAERAIFRYSKWPTQAITYRLGKEQIFALRAEAAKLVGSKFSAKQFHLLFIKQGTIPAGLFREELLRELAEKTK